MSGSNPRMPSGRPAPRSAATPSSSSRAGGWGVAITPKNLYYRGVEDMKRFEVLE